MKRVSTACALLAALSFITGAMSPVHAAEFTTVLEQESRIQFHYKQMGVTMDGEFSRFAGDFAIGEGSWSSFDIVANEVNASVRITASAN